MILDFAKLNEQMKPYDQAAAGAARARWDQIAKPVGSLGNLEKAIVDIAGLTGSEHVSLSPKKVLVMCSDNGVTEENIASTPAHITRVVAEKIAGGASCVCRMAKLANAGVLAYDVGMFTPSDKVPDHAIKRGTGNIAKGPAMSIAQAAQGVAFGIECVRQCAENGDRLLATGEMGIGNTTTTSAVAAVLLDVPPVRVTGRGAGLTDEALQKKQRIIQAAIACNRPDPADALDVLAKVGGFDIAALCGVFLGGGLYRIPVLVDGVISAVAALLAYRLCSGARLCMVASHMSAEPAARMVLDALGLSPLITAELRLGEGTGAVAAMPMLDMALDIYHHMETFADYGM